jgi:hypothetical protein
MTPTTSQNLGTPGGLQWSAVQPPPKDAKLGRKGGKATAKKRTAAQRKALAREARNRVTLVPSEYRSDAAQRVPVQEFGSRKGRR